VTKKKEAVQTQLRTYRKLETIETMLYSKNGIKPCLAGVSGRKKLVGNQTSQGSESQVLYGFEIMFNDFVPYFKINGSFERF
jgi:hypothetical protein